MVEGMTHSPPRQNNMLTAILRFSDRLIFQTIAIGKTNIAKSRTEFGMAVLITTEYGVRQ